MQRKEIKVDLKDKNICGYECDTLQMESDCPILTVCESFTKMTKVENNIYIGKVIFDGDECELRVNIRANRAYIDYVETPIKELIACFTDEEEEHVLLRCCRLKEEDYICRVYYLDGTIAFKDTDDKWYVYRD